MGRHWWAALCLRCRCGGKPVEGGGADCRARAWAERMRRAGDASLGQGWRGCSSIVSGQGGADAVARGTSDSSSTAKHIFQMLEAIIGRVIVLWHLEHRVWPTYWHRRRCLSSGSWRTITTFKAEVLIRINRFGWRTFGGFKTKRTRSAKL